VKNLLYFLLDVETFRALDNMIWHISPIDAASEAQPEEPLAAQLNEATRFVAEVDESVSVTQIERLHFTHERVSKLLTLDIEAIADIMPVVEEFELESEPDEPPSADRGVKEHPEDVKAVSAETLHQPIFRAAQSTPRLIAPPPTLVTTPAPRQIPSSSRAARGAPSGRESRAGGVPPLPPPR
jgi:hypothetical protein